MTKPTWTQFRLPCSLPLLVHNVELDASFSRWISFMLICSGRADLLDFRKVIFSSWVIYGFWNKCKIFFSDAVSPSQVCWKCWFRPMDLLKGGWKLLGYSSPTPLSFLKIQTLFKLNALIVLFYIICYTCWMSCVKFMNHIRSANEDVYHYDEETAPVSWYHLVSCAWWSSCCITCIY